MTEFDIKQIYLVYSKHNRLYVLSLLIPWCDQMTKGAI